MGVNYLTSSQMTELSRIVLGVDICDTIRALWVYHVV